MIPAFLVFVLCCCSPIGVRTEPTTETTRTAANDAWMKTVPSTVQIYQLDSAGNKDGYGAGICIASGQSELGNVYVFLTVKHVLHDRYFPIVSLMDIFIGPEEDPEPIQHCLVVFTYDDRGQPEPEKKEIKEQDAFFVKVLYKSDDLGLLFVMTHEELDINPVDLVSEEEARCLELAWGSSSLVQKRNDLSNHRFSSSHRRWNLFRILGWWSFQHRMQADCYYFCYDF